MKYALISALVLMLVSSYALASPQDSNEVADRVVRGAVVLKEIMDTPDKSVPQDLLDRCTCVAVIPGMKKGAFFFGANYGKGVISCRTDNGDGPWSAPSMLLMSGGSFGLQIGAQATDLVLVIMNTSGMESLLDSKFTLGGDASVAAGPVGRNAAAKTDAFMGAKILAYSRSKGAFAGLSLNGEVVRADQNANFVLYKKQLAPREILFHRLAEVPRDAKIFMDELTKISPKQQK
ncbi:MAG: lipid-binding SYLF domain-containing protein [Acidobacteriia bacterium]|nr:lipid-binding SYLF domain-containing protein [Terriglobia bacterium]